MFNDKPHISRTIACSRNSTAGPMTARAQRWSAITSTSPGKPCGAWICVRVSVFSISAADRGGRPVCWRAWSGEGPQGFGQVVGVDISDEMIRQARTASKEFDNVMFVVGSAAQIPWEENFFDKVLSVESFYYYPDQERALAELFRVMAPHGRLFILINLYKDNPYSLQWVPKLKVPVHVRSAAEYVELLKKHAFESVEYAQIPDDTPTPENYQTTSFHSLDDMRAFKRIGALLLMASKPDVRNPAPGYTIY